MIRRCEVLAKPSVSITIMLLFVFTTSTESFLTPQRLSPACNSVNFKQISLFPQSNLVLLRSAQHALTGDSEKNTSDIRSDNDDIVLRSLANVDAKVDSRSSNDGNVERASCTALTTDNIIAKDIVNNVIAVLNYREKSAKGNGTENHESTIPGERYKGLRSASSSVKCDFDGFVRLVRDFHAKHGALPILGVKRGDGDEDRVLSKFLAQQRRFYRTGQLSEYFIRAMEDIPGFEWKRTAVRSFKHSLELVNAFHVNYAELPKVGGKRGDEHRLAIFLRTQRFKYHSGQLAKERISNMEEIPNFDWGEAYRDFKDSVKLVTAFHVKHKELPRHRGERDDGDEDRLAEFLTQQRVQFHNGQLLEDRITVVEKIPDFDWGETLRDFQHSVELIEAFHVKYEELPRRGGKRDNCNEDRIAGFLTRQRVNFHKGQLPQDRITAMEKIPDFDW